MQKLRKWRRQQAEEEGKSPVIVALNKLLRLISAFAPQSVGEMSINLYTD
ncbi:HRDC domain-containing protein [Paenibacillus sp. 1_12]|nr:HRDC domain-containing protein [Paenibacillus sp. 1_12]